MNKIPSILQALCSLLCILLALSASAPDVKAWPQEQRTRITMHLEDAPLAQALESIKQQTHYLFANQGVDLSRTVSISVRNETVENVCETLFAPLDIHYSIEGFHIYLSNRAKADVRKVSGTIRDRAGQPVPGAVILEQGTENGTQTDQDGRFSMEVTDARSMLEINCLGYESQQIAVGNHASLQIVLVEGSIALEGTVVTALGIRRAEKALSYNVQQVKADNLVRIKDANFINALGGKVAGVTINQSSAGVGGASKVIMRGSKSIQQSSNALYVIDGIPMHNFGGGGDTEFGSRGFTEAIADLNPDDIESVSVLTGAAAAALYGSTAANGAIVITTKRGLTGKPQITFSSNTEWIRPFVLPHFQNEYGTGSRGNAYGSTILSWGPKLPEAARKGYTPEDFFRTGNVFTNSFTLSTGTERNQTFFSTAAVNSTGFIPNNRYNRYNFTFRNTTSFFRDKVKLDVGASYIVQDDRNMTNQGVYSNPLVPAYLFPRGDDFENAKIFERWDPARLIKTQYWPQGEGDLRMQNPYWIAYRNLRDAGKKRYMLSASATWKVLDWLDLSGRIRVDNAAGRFEQKLYASTISTLTEGSTQGHYTVSKSEEAQTYADLLANVDKRFGDWSIVANLGASITDTRFDELSYRGPIRENGIPNVFNVFDLDNAKKKARQTGWEEQTQSVFASAEIGWKSILYLTITGRKDWASQLANSPQSSFFYPSVGLSAVLSQMFRMPEQFDLMKVRTAYSSVGMPYTRHLTSLTYSYDETTQTWKPKTHYPIGDLYPERTESWEAGLDLRLWKDFSLALTWYRADTYNQTFDPQISVSSGYSTIYVQTGSVRNTGLELTLGYDHTWGNFSWDSGFTLSTNKNKIRRLVDNYVHPETGELITKNRLEIKGLGKAKFILKKDGTLGDLYTNSGLKRDDKAQIEIDPAGALVTVDNLPDIKLGSVFPKANLAWRNDLSFKGFTIGALLSARLGGIVYSATQAALDQYGVSAASSEARNRGSVLVEDTFYVDPQTWYAAIGSSSGLPQYYTYSATNVRLQEAYISWQLPRKWFRNAMGIQASLIGRNLLMLYNHAPFDPEAVASTGNYYQGIDYFMLPSTRNIGVNVKITF